MGDFDCGLDSVEIANCQITEGIATLCQWSITVACQLH